MTRDELIKQPPCDLNCVPSPLHQRDIASIPAECLSYPVCCRGCFKSQADFAASGGYDFFSEEDKDLVRSLWDEKAGFGSEKGCKLPRRLMPTTCLEFDCKDYTFAICFQFQNPYWQIKRIHWPKGEGGSPKQRIEPI
jgi:hypothetical protein